MDANLTSASTAATNCFSEALKTVIKVCSWVRIRHLNFLKDLYYLVFNIPQGTVLQFAVTIVKQKLNPLCAPAKIYMAGLLMELNSHSFFSWRWISKSFVL